MPPKKKKPAARAKPTARKPAARKPAARKPAARKTPAKRTARAPARAKRVAAPQRPRVALKPDAREQPSGARPVAVGSVRALWETEEAAAQAPPSRPAMAPAKETAPVVDKPLAENAVAVVAAWLAASVFLPWYHGGISTVSGWASGTWGPIIFFLSLATLAIVVLRRARIAIAFPVESTLIIEVFGWVCVIGLILKRYFPPKAYGFKLPTDGWIFASLGFALALAVLAGVASSDAALVLRPGWLKGTPGRIGLAILAIALAGGLTFAFTNTAVPTPVATAPVSPTTTYKGVPPCATRYHVPTPAGFVSAGGSEVKGLKNCNAVFSSTTLTLDQAYKRFVAALQKEGWTVTAGKSSPAFRQANLRGSLCGFLTVIQQSAKALIAQVLLSPLCASPSPTAT